MRHFVKLVIGFCLIAPWSVAQLNVTGYWLGTLNAGGTELRILFHVFTGDDGGYAATMSSLDQGAMDIPVTGVTVDSNAVEMTIPAVRGSYKGRMRDDELTIDGNWSQGGASLPLTLERTDGAPEYNRPQEPKPPFPYETEDVAYDNARAEGVRLAGTLTLPESDGPFPAVLFITGSGAQDRDESLMGHKPFLVIADHLTRRGIATLRVDDRGFGESTGDLANATTEDFASDALAGVEYLLTRSEIRRDAVGLIGHSEGGIVAPIVANMSDDVAFAVLIAPTAIPGEDLLHLQTRLILEAQGVPAFMADRSESMNRDIYAAVRESDDSEELRAAMEAVFAEMSAAERQLVDMDSVLGMVDSPWFRFFLDYNPRASFVAMACPVLALFGELDLQVPPDPNLDELKAALEEGGNADATVREIPGVNHLFQHATTGSPGEYAQIEETIAPEVLDAISGWITLRYVLGQD